MSESKPDKQQLVRRRDEILAELDRVNSDERVELDRDPEEQAIEVEQEDVSISREKSLRQELADIGSRLDGGE